MSADPECRTLPDPRLEPTVTVKRAARILGLSDGAAYVSARTGELPTLRFGNRLLVPTSRLASMLGLADPTVAAAG